MTTDLVCNSDLDILFLSNQPLQRAIYGYDRLLDDMQLRFSGAQFNYLAIKWPFINVG
jgi:hypothetical protein